MRRIASLSLLLLCSLIRVAAQADDSQQAVAAIMDEALRINIVARILPSNERPDFNIEKTRLTIPGRPVVVQFVGSNISINAILTPYLKEDGKIILVAQGQVWSSEPQAEKPVRYLSSLKSLPISLGEKILFFPLGIPRDAARSDVFNIALEIEIVPFEN
jgi:hypothetical protein